MFAIGDGAGITRGLAQAGASGVKVAQVISAGCRRRCKRPGPRRECCQAWADSSAHVIHKIIGAPKPRGGFGRASDFRRLSEKV